MERVKNFGIGTDIEDISRFRKQDSVKDKAFLNKIFTKTELEYCFSKGEAAPHLAVRYAGKEAVVKALGNMGKQIINYRDIEILNNNSGVPIVKIHNKKSENLQVNISLSHSKDKAIAFAIATKV